MVQRRKKTQKTSLTPSRKTQRQPASAPDLFDVLDEMHHCCRTITTVAALLETSHSEFLHPQVVPDAGTLIADAAGQLKALIKALKPR